MSAIYYDCEFIERGPEHPIRLLSIGLVADDGAELYRIVRDRDVINDARSVPWLAENVLPHLPIRDDPWSPGGWDWDRTMPDCDAVAARSAIADEVRYFITSRPDPELWAWYGAYDHVVLCQLFGTMAQLPSRFPMWTHDLKQEADRLGNPELPSMPGRAEHRAIDDAREVQWRAGWLTAHAIEMSR